MGFVIEPDNKSSIHFQMLLLTTLVDKLNTQTKVKILENFKKLAVAVSDIARANPQLFCDVRFSCTATSRVGF